MTFEQFPNHVTEETKLDSEDESEGSFQDLVIKFSNLRTLLEPGAGRFGNANDGDVLHKIGKNDYAVIAGVSTQDHMTGNSVGASAANDARVMSDICKIHFGLKPSRVKLLTSHTKRPSRRNLKAAIKEGFRTAAKEDLVFIYFSGHGYKRDDQHYLIPQDFRTDDIKGSGISAKQLYKWLSAAKCRKIVFLLDCCYAELFSEALYRARGNSKLDKHLYLLSSSEVMQPSVSDETWLEHGYMTFLIKHYFNFICGPTHQLSMRQMTHFIKKYTEPMSRFTYNVYDRQVCQCPVLAHLGPEDLVETDASLDDVKEELVEYWRGYLTKTRAYTTWWQDRLLDAKVLLSDATFVYSRVFYVIFLNGLHSLCILLCEQDAIHLQLQQHDAYNAFSQALQDLVCGDLEAVTHEDHERYNRNESITNPRYIIQTGVSEGIRSVTQPSAPTPAVIYTEALQV